MNVNTQKNKFRSASNSLRKIFPYSQFAYAFALADFYGLWFLIVVYGFIT